jgi:hypothetical protein
VGLPCGDGESRATNVADDGHDLDRVAVGVLLVPFAEERSRAGWAGGLVWSFDRVGGLLDACIAGARSLCLVQSRRSQHVTTREEARWLLER